MNDITNITSYGRDEITDARVKLDSLAFYIKRNHEWAHDHAHKAVDHALTTGKLLLQAKALVPHGQWGAWLKNNCSLTDRTAQRYMRVARDLPKLDAAKSATVADLPLRALDEFLAAEREVQESIEVISPPAGIAQEPSPKETRPIDVHFSNDKMGWGTPQAFFNELDSEFHFTLDVCATARNAKCKDFFTPEQDGLKQEWRGVCFCNPPYGDEIGKWVEKAYKESRKENCIVVMLIPSRTDTRWWHDYVLKASEVRSIKGRLKFEGAKDSAPFPSAVVVFRQSTGKVPVTTVSGPTIKLISEFAADYPNECANFEGYDRSYAKVIYEGLVGNAYVTIWHTFYDEYDPDDDEWVFVNL